MLGPLAHPGQNYRNHLEKYYIKGGSIEEFSPKEVVFGMTWEISADAA
jgi:hypothetical protein